MQLPILGTLSALFSDAGDEFKKLLEPWALIAAAALLALGLVFFYLPLRAGSRALLAFENWPAAWQVVVATALLFALAYLINTLSGFFLALAGGRPLRDVPWLGARLRRRQASRFDRLLATATTAAGEASARAFQRLAYEMPGRDELAPTALGNVRAAAAAYSANQYGAHLDTVWPLVALTLAGKDEELLGQLRGEQTATTFLTTVAVLLALVSVPALLLALAQGAAGRALGAAALLLPAYGLYRAAIVRALGWGRLTRAALDLYLDATGAKLGLRPLEGEPAGARARWEAVSQWLAYGGLRPGDARVQIPLAQSDWYKTADAPAPARLTAAAGVAAELRVAARPVVAYALLPNGLRLPEAAYDVTVLAAPALSAPPVSPAATAAPAAGGFVLLTDARLPYLSPTMGALLYPDGTTATVRPLIAPGDGDPGESRDAYLWPLPGLAAQGSAVLTYRAAVETWLRAGPGVALLSVAPNPSNRPDQLAVTLTYNGSPGGQAMLTCDPIAAGRAGAAFQWAALSGGLPGPATSVAVAYDPAARRATWAIDNAPPGDIFVVLTLTGHGLA
ncbi:MAG TPA: hypothetical protein PK829_10070 [Promineifilum sp.]|nr:hypothetical protein [Promineifilum sp.]